MPQTLLEDSPELTLPMLHNSTMTHGNMEVFTPVVGGIKQLETRVSALGSPLASTDSGIGDGMAPATDPGVVASYGIKIISPTAVASLTCPSTPGAQQVSTQLTGTFYVYHESGHGLDNYLVVYKEDGVLTTASTDHPLLVTVIGANKWDASRAGIGYVLNRVETGAAPTMINGQAPSSSVVSWVSSSPATVNKETQVTDQTVESFNQSVTLSAKDGASATFSHDYQIWHGTTMSVKDWAIVETTDAASKQCSWVLYQSQPWSGMTDMSNFNWWQAAYNCGGNWDDVKGFTDLSTGVMQYHTCAAWRFTNPNPGSPLNVQFTGNLVTHYCLIAMPQLGNTDHHQLFTNTLQNPWSVNIDLTALSQLE